MVHEKVVLKEDFTKAGREHEVTSEKYLEPRRTSKVKENKSQKKNQNSEDEERKLLLERIIALETETENLKTENEELKRTSKVREDKFQKRIQKSEDEKRKFELKLEQICGSEKAKVAKEIQVLQEEKKEMQRQLKVEQNRVVGAEKALKVNVCKIDEMMRQIGMLTIEKTNMQSQLGGMKESLSIEQSKRAADEKELTRLTNQVETMNKQLMFEQGLRKAAEEDSKRREEELSSFFKQMMGAQETFLRSRQELQKSDQDALGEEMGHSKQGADGKDFQPSVKCTSHDRLVEKLLKQIKQPPMSPGDCSRFVQKLRASRGGLSGLPMEVIEEEVRRMAMEEAEVKAKECPICFDPMISKLLHCKQCNQAFHSR